jgi:hypothetical protein
MNPWDTMSHSALMGGDHTGIPIIPNLKLRRKQNAYMERHT